MLLGPAAVLILGLYIYPLILVLSRSVTEPHFGLGNYAALWQSAAFRNIMRNTFEIALYTTAGCLAMAFPLAYRIVTLPPRWGHLLLALVLLPFFTAILAKLYAWTIILGTNGVINNGLKSAGLPEVSLLFNRTAVVIGTVHYLLPFMTLVLYSVMRNIDQTLMQAARSLGATRAYAFRKVYLPLTLPGVYAGSLIVFILALGFFLTPAVLGGGGDVTIATFVQQQVAVLQWATAAAMSVVLLLVTLILFYLFSRVYSVDRLVTGGVRR